MRTYGLVNDEQRAQIALSQNKNPLALKLLNFCWRHEDPERKSVVISLHRRRMVPVPSSATYDVGTGRECSYKSSIIINQPRNCITTSMHHHCFVLRNLLCMVAPCWGFMLHYVLLLCLLIPHSAFTSSWSWITSSSAFPKQRISESFLLFWFLFQFIY